MTDGASTATAEHGFSTGSLTKGKRSELDQRRLFEAKYDPATREIIENLPIRPDWNCLELGAGAGSMAYWLAERAHRGTVLATDVDTSDLDQDRAANLMVKQVDISREEFAPGTFDLVLARATLEHIANPEESLARATRWLAPGGWLLVEDFYYLPAEDVPSHVGRVLVDAYVRRMRAQDADMRWARRLPATMARAGLGRIGSRLTPGGPGQTPVDDELIGLRLRQEGHVLVESGLVTAAELADFIASLGRPESRDLTAVLISAWGQRTTVA